MHLDFDYIVATVTTSVVTSIVNAIALGLLMIVARTAQALWRSGWMRRLRTAMGLWLLGAQIAPSKTPVARERRTVRPSPSVRQRVASERKPSAQRQRHQS